MPDVVGVLVIRARHVADGTQGKTHANVLRDWIDTLILPRFDGRILPVDTAVTQCCARLHVPDPKSERGALVAATAVVHGMTAVTRNVAEFGMAGVKVLNPWA